MNTQATNSPKNLHQVGYTVLRAGAGPDMQACLVSPYVGKVKKATVHGDKLTLSLASCDIGLTSLPADIAELLAKAPDRVLIVSVDTLAAVRQSGSLADFSTNVH